MFFYTWSYLTRHIDQIKDLLADRDYRSFNNLQHLQRLPAVEAEYQKHKQELSSKGLTVHQYIKNENFGKGVYMEARYAFRRNPFPYAVEPPIQHWLIWKNPYEQERITDQEVETILYRNGYERENYLYYENPDAWKTIPEIQHIHVFLKGIDEKEQQKK